MDMTTRRTAWLLGLAGLLPFAGAALAFFAAPDSWQGFAEGALIAYGAVILSFLGAVHWGLALRAPVEEAPMGPARLTLGVVPALIGWVALLLPDVFALPLLALGILGTAGSSNGRGAAAWCRASISCCAGCSRSARRCA
jgi:hypothetical protein